MRNLVAHTKKIASKYINQQKLKNITINLCWIIDIYRFILNNR